MLLPDTTDVPILTRELLYTAVSRAKNKVYVQGTPEGNTHGCRTLRGKSLRHRLEVQEVNAAAKLNHLLREWRSANKGLINGIVFKSFELTEQFIIRAGAKPPRCRQQCVPASLYHYPNRRDEQLAQTPAGRSPGHCCQLPLLKPNDLLYQLYVLLGGPHSEVLSPQNLSWLVFKLLGQEEFITQYPKVAAYYTADETESDLETHGPRGKSSRSV